MSVEQDPDQFTRAAGTEDRPQWTKPELEEIKPGTARYEAVKKALRERK